MLFSNMNGCTVVLRDMTVYALRHSEIIKKPRGHFLGSKACVFPFILTEVGQKPVMVGILLVSFGYLIQ